MASASFDSTQNVNSMQHNVQKSDPFLEKLLLEACCEIAEKKLAARNARYGCWWTYYVLLMK